MAGKKAPSIPAAEPDLPKWIWCLVANVRDYPVDELFNVIKKERRGTKHFAPGARVYVYPVQWGDGWDRIVVVGRKKGTRRLVRKVIPGSMLEDFRLKRVYSPTVISWMCGTRFRLVRNRSDALWGGTSLLCAAGTIPMNPGKRSRRWLIPGNAIELTPRDIWRRSDRCGEHGRPGSLLLGKIAGAAP